MNEKEFNDICAEAEKLDPDTYNAMISMKTKSVLEGFTKVTGDKKSARDLFMLLVLGATVSDGGFSEKEFNLVQPLIEEAAEEEVTLEEAKEFMKGFKSAAGDFKKQLADLTEVVGMLSEDLKSDIIILCLLVCAVDEKVTVREKKWLKQLIGTEE